MIFSDTLITVVRDGESIYTSGTSIRTCTLAAFGDPPETPILEIEAEGLLSEGHRGIIQLVAGLHSFRSGSGSQCFVAKVVYLIEIPLAPLLCDFDEFFLSDVFGYVHGCYRPDYNIGPSHISNSVS